MTTINVALIEDYLKRKFHWFQELVRWTLVKLLDNYGDQNIEFDDDEDDDWVLDSGSDFHAVNDRNLLQNIKPWKTQVRGFSGHTSEVSEAGDALLPIDPSSNEYITLNGVYYIEGLEKNLLSVSRLTTDFPYSIEFDATGYVVKNSGTKEIVARGLQFRKRYYWRGIRITFGRVIRAFCNMVSIKKWIRPPESDDGLDHKNAEDLILDPNAPDQVWLLDSGAPVHLANAKVQLKWRCPYKIQYTCCDLEGRGSTISHVGTALLGLGPPDDRIKLSVQVVQMTEDNLISVARLTSDNCCSVKFYSWGFVLKCLQTDTVIARGGKAGNNTYYLSNSCFSMEEPRKRRSRKKNRTGKSWNGYR